jgi:exopolysaccharide production protein ExoZ
VAAAGGAKLEGLQALRALAALAVVLFHAGRYVAEPLPALAWRWGEFGVDVFFVVSGFVMMVAVPRGAGWRDFARRRAIRVLPMYWLATLLMATLLLAAPRLFVSAAITPAHFVLSLLLVPHYSPAASGQVVPLLVPGWTLSYELYFYLVFALFLRASDALRVLGPAAVLLALFLLGRSLPPAAGSDFLAQPLVFEFIFGLAAGALWRRGWHCPPRLAWALFTVAAVWLVFASTPAWRVPTAGVAGLAMVWSLASVELRGRAGRMLVALGDASYSLYLLHPFVVGAAWFAWQRMGLASPAAFIVACLAASAVAGWVAWRAIEAPLIRTLRPVAA